MFVVAPVLAVRRAASAALILTVLAGPGRAQTKPAPVVRPHGPAHATMAGNALPLPPPPAPPPPAAAPAGQGATAGKPAVPAKPPPPPPDPNKGTSTGLPVPRFVSLRADKVNLRAGPGNRYPIEWVYQRAGLPVEIEREFDIWRLIKDQDGIRGWVQEVLLTGRRTFVVTGADRTLRREPEDTARPVAILKQGVVGRILTCPAKSDWCKLEVDGYRGWLKRADFWGTLPDEVVGSR
jgi:SH3-like domain-containing protein